MLGAAGLEAVEERTAVNHMRSAEEKVFLAELVDNTREAILAAGVATAAEIDDLREAVAAAARDPGTVCCQADHAPGARHATAHGQPSRLSR